MAAELPQVAPEVVSYTDDCHCELTIEITLPGVSEKDISLSLYEDTLDIFARREDVEFASTISFCCPVKPELAQTFFESGMLKVIVPLKEPLDDSGANQVG